MSVETNHVFNHAIAALTRAISALEGHSFGSHFRFASFQSGLHHSCEGGWRKCEEFGMFMPGTLEFAKELNEVMQPVMQRYAERLRQELANECTKLGAAALKPTTFRT